VIGGDGLIENADFDDAPAVGGAEENVVDLARGPGVGEVRSGSSRTALDQSWRSAFIVAEPGVALR